MQGEIFQTKRKYELQGSAKFQATSQSNSNENQESNAIEIISIQCIEDSNPLNPTKMEEWSHKGDVVKPREDQIFEMSKTFEKCLKEIGVLHKKYDDVLEKLIEISLKLDNHIIKTKDDIRKIERIVSSTIDTKLQELSKKLDIGTDALQN